jgi:hypothetical protein
VIESATVDVPARLRDWRLWTDYCAANGYPDPYLAAHTPALRVNVLVAFAARYRTGVLGKGQQVKAGSVTTALRHVGQMYELVGLPDPWRPHGGNDLSLIFAQLLRSYRSDDPPTQSKISLRVKIFENIAAVEGTSTSPLERAIADTITIMFFYLLRIGEASCPATRQHRRTVQFRQCDASFWKRAPDGRLVRLHPTTPLAELLLADEATIKLSNQKNGIRDATLHHEGVPGTFSPVVALCWKNGK